MGDRAQSQREQVPSSPVRDASAMHEVAAAASVASVASAATASFPVPPLLPPPPPPPPQPSLQQQQQQPQQQQASVAFGSNPQLLLRQQAHSTAVPFLPTPNNQPIRFQTPPVPLVAVVSPRTGGMGTPQRFGLQPLHLPPPDAASISQLSNAASEPMGARDLEQHHHHQQQHLQQLIQQQLLLQQPQPMTASVSTIATAQQEQLYDPFIPERETEFDESTLHWDTADPETALSGWSEVDVSQDGQSTPPSPRSLHAAAVLNGVLYVFGGYDGTQRVNTFHAFSFAEKRWSPVLPSAHSGPAPTPRDRHVSFSFGNSFYVHGGFDGRSRVSDMYGFDFSTMSWREINTTSGRVPSARHSHSAVVYGQSVYIAFGYDGSYKSDIHEYDFAQSRWNAVPAAGRRPRARYRATAVVHKKYMIVYGGHDGVRHLSDTNVFDLETKTWSNLMTQGPAPVPRDSHVSVMHGSSMFVFAGSSGTAMNDFHELQIPASTMSTIARWRPVNTPAKGYQPRQRFCHVGVVHDSSLYCFGGYDGQNRLNDFVRFDFTVYDLSFDIPPTSLVSDLRSMVNNSTLSDVTFLVEGIPVYAHKLLLMRCSYFAALFMGPMRESRMSEIPISQVRHPIFVSILEYLYTDHLKITLGAAMEIFEAADLFGIPRLQTMCEKRMLQSITVENAAAIFHAADLHSAVALRQKAKKFVLAHFEEVSKTLCFEEMGRNNIDLVFELLHSR